MKILHARKKLNKIKDLSFLTLRWKNVKICIYKFDMFTGPYLELVERQTCF